MTGYRQPRSSVTYCIISAFRLNNETFNIWTHFLPLIFLLVHFYRTFPSDVYPPASIPTQYYPLLTMEASVCAYLLGSTVAHTFNCMTPRLRHVCFYVDYAAISMFGVGGACTTFYYLRPLNIGFFLYDSPNLFLGGSALCNLVATYFSCASRHRWESSKYIIRTLAFALPFMYGNFPAGLRLLMCILGWGECTHAMNYLFLSWTAYFAGAILNSTRLPERFFPGYFDILGHNHQWLHIITTLGTVSHFWAVQVALEVRKDLMPVLLDGLTLYSSLGWMLGTFFVTCVMAVWFGCQLTEDGYLKRHKQS